MSQPELARRTGCHQSAVSHWERGMRTPPLRALIAVAAALGCTVGDLADALDERGGTT